MIAPFVLSMIKLYTISERLSIGFDKKALNQCTFVYMYKASIENLCKLNIQHKSLLKDML